MSAAIDPKGKVALVTGSTSGIGLAIARSLAKRGVNIILHGSRDKSLVSSTLEEIRSYGVRADYVACDLSKLSNIESMWTQVLHLYSEGVDILINNAGAVYLCNVENYPINEWDRTIAINLSAPFHLIKSTLPGMKKKGWGRIVNVSSVTGVIAAPEYGVYSASKHGLQGLTKGVALENAQYGITCNTVNPAFTQTRMLDYAVNHVAQSTGLSPSVAVGVVEKVLPTGTINTPEQVAELTEFLCLSSASSQMTGAAYLIDSAATAQ